MSKKRQNHNRKPTNGLWGLLLAGALGAGSLAAWVQMNPTKEIPASEKRVSRLPEHQDSVHSSSETNKGKVQVLKPRYEGDELKYDRHEAEVPTGEDKMVYAVNQYLKASKIAPSDALAVKATLASNGDLKLDFNPAFDHTYGSEDERALVDGILHTLGQFPEINSVSFTIKGEQLETLGHIDLTTPQAVLRD